MPGATGCFFVVDLAFFASNLLKAVPGRVVPVDDWRRPVHLMMTWKQGRRLLNDKRADAIDLKDFLESVSSAHRPGWKARPFSDG